MTEVSTKARRKRRYEPTPAVLAVSLTPLKLALLYWVAHLRFGSARQLARLTGISPKSAERHLRQLFDARLLAVIAIPRAALLAKADPNDASVLFGSAPNLWSLSRAGHKALIDQGLDAPAWPRARFGPQNFLFLRHELAVNDVRIWLSVTARRNADHRLATWRQGKDALMQVPGLVPTVLRPDAWFVYSLAAAVLVGLVEVDLGTERARHWRMKLAGYQALFASGELSGLTGYKNARLLIITPDEARRDALAKLVAIEASPQLTGRVWLAAQSVLDEPDLSCPCWQVAGNPQLVPLISPQVATAQRDAAAHR